MRLTGRSRIRSVGARAGRSRTRIPDSTPSAITCSRYRTASGPALYSRDGRQSDHGARKILDGVREGRIDVGPLDAYWHMLIARHAPELTSGIRVLASTDVAPMPAFVAAAERSRSRLVRDCARLLLAASPQPGSVPLGDLLCWRVSPQRRQAYFDRCWNWDRAARRPDSRPA